MDIDTPAARHVSSGPAPEDPWAAFAAGVARAEGELGKLAADLLLLPRIIADPAAHGLDRPGALAGYLARVLEALRRP